MLKKDSSFDIACIEYYGYVLRAEIENRQPMPLDYRLVAAYVALLKSIVNSPG